MTANFREQQPVAFRFKPLFCLLAALLILCSGNLQISDVVDSPNDDGVTAVWQLDTAWFETSGEDWVLVPMRAGGWTSMMPYISEAREFWESRPFILEKIGLSFLLTSNHLFRP